jgi:N-acetylated-alpha-linked acidic dipeptidase
MSSETQPLISNVRVAPPRQRYPHSTIRRFCTIAFGSTLLVVVFLIVLPAALLPSPHHRHGRHGHQSLESTVLNTPVSYTDLQEILLTTPDPEKVEEWSYYYTSGPHLAGKNFSQAEWTMNLWTSFGIPDSSIVAYDTYINYPIGHRLALYEKNSSKSDLEMDSKDTWKLKFEASMEEDVIEEDPTTGREDRIPTFHGYSASGNVTAPYVYVNYGTYQDFEDLIKANVSLKGNIAIARYGGIFRGLKVKRAQELGMIGVVLYSDPGDDGPQLTDGVKTYPDGPARNPSSVQRGSTQFLSVAPGDPYVLFSFLSIHVTNFLQNDSRIPVQAWSAASAH